MAIENLPGWAGPLVSFAGVAGAAGAAFLAAWKGFNSKSKQASEAPNTLIAGDIMDTKPMKDLAHQVQHLAEACLRIEQAIEHNTDAANRVEASNRSIEVAVRSLEAANRDLCRVIERKT